MDTAKPGDPLTAAEFRVLTPYWQGYAAYMQGAWNCNVPDDSPYDDATKDSTANYAQWLEGNRQACLAVQDGSS